MQLFHNQHQPNIPTLAAIPLCEVWADPELYMPFTLLWSYWQNSSKCGKLGKQMYLRNILHGMLQQIEQGAYFPCAPTRPKTLFSCRWLCNRAPQAKHSRLVLQWNHIAMMECVQHTVWILSRTAIQDRWQLLIGPDYWEVWGYEPNSGNSCADVCVRMLGEGIVASRQLNSG